MVLSTGGHVAAAAQKRQREISEQQIAQGADRNIRLRGPPGALAEGADHAAARSAGRARHGVTPQPFRLATNSADPAADTLRIHPL
jgi:hypothetical protein